MNVTIGIVAASALAAAIACSPPPQRTTTPEAGGEADGAPPTGGQAEADGFEAPEPRGAPPPPAPRGAPPAPAPASPLPAEMQALLDAHNRARAAHCAAPLAWSPKLAASALAWAQSLRDRRCAFEHSRTQHGENLAGGTAGALGAEGVTAMWYDEVELYDFRKPGFAMATGHFTQVVWKGTTQLGCGRATCKNGMELWVCQYDPPGNMQGAYPQNVVPRTCR